MSQENNMLQPLISKKQKKIVERINKLHGDFDVTELSAEQIFEYNSQPIANKRLAKKLLKKFPNRIDTSTFIIPVEGGVVTGYFYQRRGLEKQQLINLRPLLIYFHGGGWIWGNMEFYNNLCGRLSELTHADVLAVDYRLAPQYKFPTAVEDCYNTLLWAAQGARYWKIDPEQIYLAGDSAGGNLAAVVSRLSRDRKGPHIAGQILLYPITDGRLRTTSLNTFRETPTLTARELQFYVKSYQSEPKDILNPNFSPLLSKDHSRLPPTLIITSDNDPLRDDGYLYAEALESADTPVRHLEVKDSFHGFFPYPDANGTDESESAILQFMAKRPLETIELISKKELKKRNRAEIIALRKSGRLEIEVESS